MRLFISCGLIVTVAACSALTPEKAVDTDTEVPLSDCRFDFVETGGANAICMSGEALVKLSLPSCKPGKPSGPSVQVADERAVLTGSACIASFGGQKWLVATE